MSPSTPTASLSIEPRPKNSLTLQTFQTMIKEFLGRGSILSDAIGVDGLAYLPSLPLLSLLDGLKPCLSYLISSEIFDVISV